jgi:hypothetical protein
MTTLEITLSCLVLLTAAGAGALGKALHDALEENRRSARQFEFDLAKHQAERWTESNRAMARNYIADDQMLVIRGRSGGMKFYNDDVNEIVWERMQEEYVVWDRPRQEEGDPVDFKIWRHDKFIAAFPIANVGMVCIVDKLHEPNLDFVVHGTRPAEGEADVHPND